MLGSGDMGSEQKTQSLPSCSSNLVWGVSNECHAFTHLDSVSKADGRVGSADKKTGVPVLREGCHEEMVLKLGPKGLEGE